MKDRGKPVLQVRKSVIIRAQDKKVNDLNSSESQFELQPSKPVSNQEYETAEKSRQTLVPYSDFENNQTMLGKDSGYTSTETIIKPKFTKKNNDL